MSEIVCGDGLDRVITPATVVPPIEFRRAALANGYKLVRVETRGKRPLAKGWTAGESADALLTAGDGTNTGVVLSGLCVIDFDIDDAIQAHRVLLAALPYLPKGGLIRQRAGSPRVAFLYRFGCGDLRKRSVRSELGGVDILGAGCQVVADGIHPSGQPLMWRGNRSPANVPVSSLPILTADAIENLQAAIAQILAPAPPVTHAGNLPPPSMPLTPADELGAGICSESWFAELEAHQKQNLVRACLAHIDNSLVDPRDLWLQVLFAIQHAAREGCPNARDMALQWSKAGAAWSSESDFETAWNSYRPGRTTIGTLLYLAKERGLDLTPWREAVSVANGATAVAPTLGGALHISALPANPPKREWLHGTDLARGAVSLLVAPGGRGKSSWLTALALAAASGRPLLGSHVYGGPLRVLYLNCEDSTDELCRRFRAATMHHRLTDADLPGLMVAGADRINYRLLQVERSAPQLDPLGWTALRAEVGRIRPDVIMIDPLVAVIGGASLNDNTAAAMLMRELVTMAASQRCAIMVAHHTSKGSDVRNADAAMGAASLVNLARIALSLKSLSESDAPRLGVAPVNAATIFQILGTKQNLSRPGTTDRWFRLVSVDLPNAAPPVYPHGDKVGVVELFTPLPAASAFSPADLQIALVAIASAQPPLSPSPRANDYAVPVIADALTRQRGTLVSEDEAKAILGNLIGTGRVIQAQVKVGRAGRGGYARTALAVAPTPAAASHGIATPP